MAKEIPIGVKIISIVYYVAAGLALIMAIMLFTGAAYVNSILGSIPLINILGILGSGLFVFGGIASLLSGVLSFFIGRGLWKLKNWARIFVIIFACIGVLIGIFSLFSWGAIVMLAVNGAIGGYLIFSKEVKEAFK